MTNAKKKPQDITRRSFLGAGLAAGSLTSRAGLEALTTVEKSGDTGKGRRRFTLWCATGGLIRAEQPSDEAEVVAFVEKCARHGVTHLVPTRGSQMLTKVAGKQNIDVHPYVAFNSHGANREHYAWSVHYVGDPPGSPVGTENLNRHRAIWSHPKTTVSLSEFAREHPEYWGRTQRGGNTLAPGQRLNLSLAVPEVRAYEVNRYLEMLDSNGGNGVQIEFVTTNTDSRGVGIYGYEDPMAKGYEKTYGRSPFSVLTDRSSWLRYRADYVTQTLTEIRDKLNDKYPGAPLSVTVIAQEFTNKMMIRGRDRYLKVFQDIRAWVDRKVVDQLFLWFRTTSDPAEVGRRVGQVTAVVQGRCPVIAELSCYHVGSFQDPKLMLEAARQAMGNGADSVGMYRGHAVDQLNFWPLVEEISKMA